MKIKDVIKGKASQAVVTIAPEATVRELVALLAEHNVGALVVSEDGERDEGRPDRHPAHVVLGAVDRVDDPPALAVPGRALLLADDRVAGPDA